jgi:hypothetical protein
MQTWMQPPLPGADRGSRAWRSRQGRLRRLPSRCAADAGISARLGLSPRTKVLDLTGRVRCRGCGARGRTVVSVKWGRPNQCAPPLPRWTRNTATFSTLLGSWTAALQLDPHSSRNAPGWRNRAESEQRDQDLWPGGNTAPETTLLSGYGVDTLRRADNVRGTGRRRGGRPGRFQRGLSRRGKGAASGWGTSPTLLPARAWPGTPSPVQFYTRFGSIR